MSFYAISKSKIFIFHKWSKKENIPLSIPKLKLDKYEINKNAESIKLLGVLTWKPPIKLIENFKKLSAYYLQTSHFWINNHLGKYIYDKLKQIFYQQKHTTHIICNKEKFEHTKDSYIPVVRNSQYVWINILNVATFIQSKSAPNNFRSKIPEIISLLPN